jgi:simple sugar transport system permease protein
MAWIATLLSVNFGLACFRMTIPLLLPAMGGLFSEITGVLNIALEGMMLVGAFTGWYYAYLTHNVWIGVLAAIGAGVLFGLFHAVITVSIGADQIVTALVENMVALGLTSTLLFAATASALGDTSSPILPQMPIPILSKIPVLGPLFFSQDILFYLAVLMIPLSYWVFYKTTWGLSLRSVGEHPIAADTLGIHVLRTRYIGVVISGVLASLGGASLTVGDLHMFVQNMTAGRGFIAFTAIIFGKYRPGLTAAACLLFGVVDAFQLRLQGLGVALPSEMFLMLPYVITLLMLIFVVHSSYRPKAQGVPYIRGQR